MKAWQKGGLLLGFLHFIVSMVLILTRGDGGGLIFVEIWIESPWLFVLYLLGIKNPANFLVYPIIPIFIGSIT
ncbi:MAG TPA: hypothetical protein VLB09_01950, partial [Nitrospiria bacterium]|nr:hypothetical protein [Nitrospiria bacterium]